MGTVQLETGRRISPLLPKTSALIALSMTGLPALTSELFNSIERPVAWAGSTLTTPLPFAPTIVVAVRFQSPGSPPDIIPSEDIVPFSSDHVIAPTFESSTSLP